MIHALNGAIIGMTHTSEQYLKVAISIRYSGSERKKLTRLRLMASAPISRSNSGRLIFRHYYFAFACHKDTIKGVDTRICFKSTQFIYYEAHISYKI